MMRATARRAPQCKRANQKRGGRDDARTAKEIIVGVRPAEHVSVADGPEEGIDGQVVLVESLGADSYVHASIEGSETSFIARTDGYDARRPGTNVRLRIDSSKLYAFDSNTEERLGGGTAPSGSDGADAAERPLPRPVDPHGEKSALGLELDLHRRFAI